MFCISENKILKIENDTIKELPSQKIIKYRESLKEIQKRSEWKTSGQGAMFTGTAKNAIDYDNYNRRILQDRVNLKLVFGVDWLIELLSEIIKREI